MRFSPGVGVAFCDPRPYGIVSNECHSTHRKYPAKESLRPDIIGDFTCSTRGANAPRVGRNRMNNLEMFTSVIYTDRAISMRQAKRFFNCTEADVLSTLDRHKFAMKEVEIPRTHGGKTDSVTVVCVNSSTAARPFWRLRHLLALAEFRQLVGATSRTWRLRALENPRDHNGAFLTGVIPDAVWHKPGGASVIEYDAGSHTQEVVAEKILAYAKSEARFVSQIWVVGSAERAQNIVSTASLVGVENCSTVVLPWWY
jgi:Replication-relaxation